MVRKGLRKIYLALGNVLPLRLFVKSVDSRCPTTGHLDAKYLKDWGI